VDIPVPPGTLGILVPPGILVPLGRAGILLPVAALERNWPGGYRR